MISVARKNLLYNRTRLATALGGVAFGVVLTFIEMGVLFGFLNNAVKLIEHSPAELWLVPPGTKNQDLANNIPARLEDRVAATEGVAWAEKLIVTWQNWKGVDGRKDMVQIVGVDLDGRVGIPFAVEPEVAARLREPDVALLDESGRKRLNVTEAGAFATLGGKTVEIGGFTRGGQSFTTAPLLVLAYAQAEEFLANLPATKGARVTTFIQVKVKDGESVAAVRERLRSRITNAEVLTKSEFRFRTKWHWGVGTGMGLGFLFSALMGLLVGGAVVGQVLYANVMEQLKEFAMLKALGASPRKLLGILLEQTAYIGVGGCVCGFVAAVCFGRLVAATQTPISFPWFLIVGTVLTTMAICLAASWVPARVLRNLEPALVFTR
jgi:putative ABC transport system permease protein